MVLFYFAGATGGELIAPQDVCSAEAFEECMGGGMPPIPEDWEGEPAEFCPACIDAWFFGAHEVLTENWRYSGIFFAYFGHI